MLRRALCPWLLRVRVGGVVQLRRTMLGMLGVLVVVARAMKVLE